MSNDGKATSPNNLATQPVAPRRFRCKVGGEWKPLESFSNSQQRMIQRQIETRRPIDAAHSGMTCRDHTAGQRTEIQCSSCGTTKHADEFSRSSRRNGVFQCMRCIAWTETQESKVTPSPLETGHISVEEERKDVWNGDYIESTDFFDDDIMPQAPITDMGSLGLQDLDSPGVNVNDLIDQSKTPTNISVDERSSAASTVPPSQKSSFLPPHLGGSKRMDMDTYTSRQPFNSATASSSASARSGSGKTLPPHILAKVVAARAIAGDAASDYSGGDVCLSGSISTATTMREGKEGKKHPISFNAWDASGNQHRGVKSATSASAATSDTGDGDSYGLGNLALDNEPVPRGRNKWPKSGDVNRLTQTELRKQGGNHHIAARTIDPAIDHQHRYNVVAFCEPDDGDDIYDA